MFSVLQCIKSFTHACEQIYNYNQFKIYHWHFMQLKKTKLKNETRNCNCRQKA